MNAEFAKNAENPNEIPTRRSWPSRRSLLHLAFDILHSAFRVALFSTRLAVRSVFAGTRDESGLQADAFCGAQVAKVRRHHRDFRRLQAEKIRGRLVHLSIGLVVTHKLGAEDAI